MIRSLAFAAAPLAALAITGCAPTEGGSEPDIRAPAAIAVGEPVNCITRQNIDSLAIHDDYTIDFRMPGGDVYRNTLPGRCPTLGFEERISYNVSTSQLCSTDTFRVLESGGRETVSCGFGKFTPVRLTGS